MGEIDHDAEASAIVRILSYSWASAPNAGADAHGAIRCGMGDAAGLCDALETIILREHRTRGGKGPPSKKGRELASTAKRCADAIWAMREGVGRASE